MSFIYDRKATLKDSPNCDCLNMTNIMETQIDISTWRVNLTRGLPLHKKLRKLMVAEE